jgi:uncharacterized protein (DUF1501 family)
MLCETPNPSRRLFLSTSGVLFAWAFLPKFARAANPQRDPRLITIILRGALDGLSAVAPVGDPDYVPLRDEIALRKDDATPALALDSFFALHPALPNLKRLYDAKQATIVHAVATGYRERSHFDGQDVLESGLDGPGNTDSGWLNRLIGVLPPGERVKPAKALGIGSVTPVIVRGPAPVLGWAPDPYRGADADLARRVLALYGERDPVLLAALQAGLDTEAMAQAGGVAKGKPGGSQIEAMLTATDGAARLMRADDGPRVAALGFDGWDTHANQGGATGRLATLLSGLDQSLARFETTLGPVWQDTVIAVVTEFGRTARPNGTDGSDHGTATVAFLVGGAVNGGRVIADWPGLRSADLYENRDLKPTTDLRAVFKGLARDHLGVPERLLSEQVFPGTIGLKPIADLVA